MMMEPPIWLTVKEVNDACERHLREAQGFKEALLAVKGTRTLENTLGPMNQVLVAVDAVVPMSELVANTHPDKAVRDAAEACGKKGQKFHSELMLDRGVYEALEAVPADLADREARRFRRLLLRDYRRAGVDRDAATRKKLAALHDRMVALEQTFSRDIREDKRSMDVTEAQLKGMPADWLAARKKNAKNGKITITTDYPDFYPVESYAQDPAVRRDLYKIFLQRAMPKNEPVLKELLTVRYQYATLLGFEDWAAYYAGDKMAKNKKTIAAFIHKVAALARPRMDKDLKDILARKRKDHPRAKVVGAWDRFYYVNKIKAERYGVDTEAVRAYFPYEKVKEGVLGIAQQMFGLTFKRVEGARVWHPSVEAYDVLEAGKRVGRFYLDMHPREGKYGHAAEFPMITGVAGQQLPAASLVTNFPDPARSDGPALMEHSQVTTFFHEFGHLMHQILSGRHAWVTLSGINCEWDFVEAPSQLLEEWTWDHSVLATFAKHYKTGKPMTVELVDKMRKARDFGKGVNVMRQMFYASLSYQLHAQDPSKFDVAQETHRIQKLMSPYPYQKGTAVQLSFGHLGGYSSAYYTYMWSLVLAKDMFTRFQQKGLLNHEVSMAYRKAILEPGGSVDAADMVKTFLGRPYSFDAFKAWLSR